MAESNLNGLRLVYRKLKLKILIVSPSLGESDENLRCKNPEFRT